MRGFVLMGLAACGASTRFGSSSPAELAGAVAGPAQRCIAVQRSEAFRLEAERTLLYGRGRTIWVNRLPPACAGIRRTDVLIVEPLGARACAGDLLRSADPVSGEPGPGCVLGSFIPYRR